MKNYLRLKGLAILTVSFASSMSAFAATPISDAAGLAAIGNDLQGDYELTADITLTGTWSPIGNNDAPFTGTFDGKGHTIKGLTYTENGNWVGLFGAVTGAVKNVCIVEANIFGNEHVGILAGRVCDGGTVENVFTSGYLCGRDHAGGIVGDAGEGSATVKNCLSTAYVYARDYQAGGIAGWTKGTVTISNNVFLGEAVCGGWAGVGGIVGFVEDGTTTVTNNVCAAKWLQGTAYDPDNDNQRETRGIVGSTYNDNSILVSTDNLVSSATVIYNQSAEVVDQSNMSADFNGIITPEANLKLAATYTALNFGSAWSLADGRFPVLAGMTLPIAGDYIYVSEVSTDVYVDNTLDLHPISTFGRTVSITTSDASVASIEGTVVSFLKAGNVTITMSTAGDSFSAGYTRSIEFTVTGFDGTIATAADMEKLSLNPSANFTLAADIDMTGVEYTPVPYFSGNIDGQGHYIRNLTFKNSDRDKAALISEFAGEYIKNLGFENLTIVGNADVAAVAGKTTSNGVISNIVVSNSYIEGRDHVASFVGNLDGNATIVNCISNASVATRSYQVGGIAGVQNYGTIDKCIFAGTVSSKGGATNVCGISSLLDSDGNPSVISNCLAAAASYSNCNDASNIIIALSGRQMTLDNNYVAEYSLRDGVLVSGSYADTPNGAIATTAQIRSQAWYAETLGFDFTNDWKFLAGADGKMLPVLKWMDAPLTTTFFNLPTTDGVNLVYIEGTEFYNYTTILGSWGQNMTVSQISGEDYACVIPEDGRIYVGNEDGELVAGAGTATFKVSVDAAISSLFTLEGRDTFDVNVSINGAETEISTADQFVNIRKNPSGKFVLTADIDLAGVEFNGFCNDGSSSFTGTIDGQGHSVKNFHLVFDEDASANKGLFGKTSGATFKNIGFTNFSIDGSTANHVGLIGQGSAYFENIAIVGFVKGDDHVGLVAGDADGIEMLNCYAYGIVEGRSQIGGYFGCTLEGGCTLTNCLSNVEASASLRGWVGGFIGLIDKDNSIVTIENCVSIGNCSAQGSGSPLVTAPFIAGNGADENPKAVVNFAGNIYNSTAIMDAGSDWPSKNETAEGGIVEAAAPMNPNALATESTYTAIDWDFENVWVMNTTEDYKYPVLKGVPVADFTVSGESEIEIAESAVRIAATNGQINVYSLGETSSIAVYTTTGMKVAAANVNAAEAAVNVPAGLYIVAVVSDGATTTAKVIVK